MLREKGLLYGGIIGDILGVPFEFLTRQEMQDSPFTGKMVSGGFHNQPLGAWSDDTALTLCLIDAMIGGLNLNKLANNFIKWDSEGLYCSGDKLFDMGIATRLAIEKLKFGISPLSSGGKDFYSNGNGSLMRIAPLYFIFHQIKDDFQKFVLVQNVSGLTHAHPISVYSCYFYLLFFENLYKFQNKHDAFLNTQHEFRNFLKKYPIGKYDSNFTKILSNNFHDLQIANIHGTGFVIHTLESSIWCFLKGNSFTESMILAINIGDDTDTTASVCGSLCGFYYGLDNIPQDYLNQIPKKDEIDKLINNFLNDVFNTR